MAVMVAVASIAVLMPLYRRPGDVEKVGDHEAAIYRDQLSEVDKDVERGLIDAAEAGAARAEIARRLIRAADGAGSRKAGSGVRRRQAAALTVILGVPLATVGLYLYTGQPGLPDAPLSARLSAPPAERDLPTLIANVEAHLTVNPDDASGWAVIAPVYVSVGRYDDAVIAFRNIVRLSGSTVQTELNLGEAIVRANDGLVTEDARQAFHRALDDDPQSVGAQYYLAVGQAQQGNPQAAAASLRRLIAQGPEDAAWIPQFEQMVAGLEAAEEPQETMSGPTAAQIAAAEDLAPEDRMAMIEGMVSSLSARLQESPDDPTGWARLVRSYIVLGRPDEARRALEQATAIFAEDTEKLDIVQAEAQAAGLID